MVIDPNILAIVSFAAIAIAIPPMPRPVNKLVIGKLRISAIEKIPTIKIIIFIVLLIKGASKSSYFVTVCFALHVRNNSIVFAIFIPMDIIPI